MKKPLHTFSKGNKRDPSDLLTWQANMDVNYVMDAYACYVCSFLYDEKCKINGWIA